MTQNPEMTHAPEATTNLEAAEGDHHTQSDRAEEAANQRPSDLVKDTLPDEPAVTPAGDKPDVEQITEALKDVVDPELGINVVDLGLVYGLHVDDDHSVTVDMTLTSAACPLTDVIEDQVSSALADLTTRSAINWVWMPPWTPEKISDDGRDQLRVLGFNV
ncbi:metal-sulfur cluster assembly factor [Mariniluteicoccus flavus]